MTLLDFDELAAYWTEHPPLHILVGAYFGVDRDKHKRGIAAFTKSCHVTGSDLESVLAELGPGFGTGDIHAGLAPVVLDFDQLRRRTRAGD